MFTNIYEISVGAYKYLRDICRCLQISTRYLWVFTNIYEISVEFLDASGASGVRRLAGHAALDAAACRRPRPERAGGASARRSRGRGSRSTHIYK